MTCTDTLENPRAWALPKLITGPNDNPGWYPQVIGDPAIQGTDKRAGARARYFDAGQSNSIIVFADEGAAATASPTFGDRRSR
ncbi:MAG TPA: hypothetical protein VH417_11430 [Vicinamibacterales bacterium]|jgi:hypothetical protein